MLKKMFSVMLLALSLFLGSQAMDTNRAEAVDVYAGQAYGVDVYVSTDSINVQTYEPAIYYFAVTTKDVIPSTGALYGTARWEFRFKGRNNGDYRCNNGKWMPVKSGSLHEKIRDIALDYIR